jgi:hypothetical protein
MYTLIQTAKLNNVDPQAWLADALARIADHPINRVEELLPWKWKLHAETARYLKQLEQELLALGDDAMLLEELDGFIAGLLVCPELIKPSEWLPLVWGSEEKTNRPSTASTI